MKSLAPETNNNKSSLKKTLHKISTNSKIKNFDLKYRQSRKSNKIIIKGPTIKANVDLSYRQFCQTIIV